VLDPRAGSSLSEQADSLAEDFRDYGVHSVRPITP
jgi:hypothetical protein